MRAWVFKAIITLVDDRLVVDMDVLYKDFTKNQQNNAF